MDWYLFSLLNGLAGRWPVLDLLLSNTARYGLFVLILPLFYLWFAGARDIRVDRRERVLQAVAAVALALAVNQLIGLVYFRPRPFAFHQVRLLLPPSPDPSFPSDHATAAWALSWGLRGGPPWLTGLMFLGSVLLMLSRVFVGLHYPLDTLGGAAMGILASTLVKRVWPRFSPLLRRLLSP